MFLRKKDLRRNDLQCALLALACAAAVGSNSAMAQDCVLLKQGMSEPGAFRYGPDSPAPGRTVIDRPGHYCLSENLQVKGHYWPFTPEGDKLFSDDILMMRLAADDITVDFKKHSATSDADLEAGVMTPRGRPSTVIPKYLPDIVPKNLTIKNGSIRIWRHGMAIEIYGVGPQELLVNIMRDATEDELPQYRGEPWILGYINSRRAELRATFMPNAAAYPVRNLHIENMRIRSQDYAVVLQGANSVVRESVIETDSGTALWLYGPNAVIENNTFIVHCLSRPMSHDGVARCDDMDAPIRLQHGDGAVIRNNRFVLLDKAKPRVVSLFDTSAITFEGNTIIGLDALDKAVQVFRGPREIKTLASNRLDNSVAAKVKSWLEPAGFFLTHLRNLVCRCGKVLHASPRCADIQGEP